jgi:hypothetical protein
MAATIIAFLGSYISKEFLISIFKEVFLEVAIDYLDEFVADTKNPYDDKLAATFREFIEDRD